MTAMTDDAPHPLAHAGIDILDRATRNDAFREVVSTGPNAQVVVMSIPPDGSIGEETHAKVDQVFVVVAGVGCAIIDGERSPISAGILVHVPAGTSHDIQNEGAVDLKLYTIYAPPQHAPGTIHQTKAEADADDEHA